MSNVHDISEKPRRPHLGTPEPLRVKDLLAQRKQLRRQLEEAHHPTGLQRALLAMQPDVAMRLMQQVVLEIERRQRQQAQAKTDEFLEHLRTQHFQGVK
jgi:hypothetical protein